MVLCKFYSLFVIHCSIYATSFKTMHYLIKFQHLSQIMCLDILRFVTFVYQRLFKEYYTSFFLRYMYVDPTAFKRYSDLTEATTENKLRYKVAWHSSMLLFYFYCFSY